MSGFFISLEGIEGSGKSSLSASLDEWLTSLGKEVVLTREPGGTEIGLKIRELLLKQHTPPPSSMTELLLFSADRAEHVAHLLLPALAKNQVILCDRYVHSTFAYQGFARGVSHETLQTLVRESTQGLLPDVVLLLDLDAETGLSRARKRTAGMAQSNSESWTRFEAEELEFHQKVREGFLSLSKSDPGRFIVLDASKSIEEVVTAAKVALEKRLPR